MNILDKIFGRNESVGDVKPDQMGELVAEACRLKNRSNLYLTPEEMAHVAAEMNVDEAFLNQAFVNVRRRRQLKYVMCSTLGVSVAVVVILSLHSWLNRPVITQGDSSLLEAGLEDIQNGR